MGNRFRISILTFAIFLCLGPRSWSQLLYATGEADQQLDEVNMATGSVTVLFSGIGGRPDSLLVDSLGRIVYTIGKPGDIDIYDPSTGLNSVLATGLSFPRDLVFDPGEATLLVANFGVGAIDRVDMTTGAVTPLLKKQATVDGLAYDAQGNLFANVNHHTQIIQVDPQTGAILKTLTVVTNQQRGYWGLDGLTYDPYTGELWATDVGTGANCLVEIPTDLSTFSLVQVGQMTNPDGIISDGMGNLFIGVSSSKVYEYNIPSNTITKEVKVKDVDSVALVPASK